MPRKKKSTEQLSLLDIPEEVVENIQEADYSSLMRKNFLDYSMSVITARAVPDVRDGLKPVQRRILYDMDELGTASDKPYRKSARIVGDTMGKYHPHGDSSIYGAMTVMAQDFKNNAVLIDGHGNFGSIEGDGAAAMRYTEARLSKAAEEIYLKDLDVTDYIDNFDATEKEAAVLPCRIPAALVNGSEGIAVGMTTGIAPHNLREVIDAALMYEKGNREASTEELLAVMHGPDLPTGGIVTNSAEELKNIYETGEGKLRLRGKIELEKLQGGRSALVVSEIPYTMVGAGIEKFLLDVENLVETKVLTQVSDISNQSDKNGIRLVIELKRGAEQDAERIKNILFKKTKLEDTFPVSHLLIHNGRPEIMSLTSMFNAYWDYQYDITTRRTELLLKKAQNRLEVVEGLIGAVDVIDTIIEAIRGSQTIAQVKECLMHGTIDKIKFKTKAAKTEAATFAFSEVQTNAILAMSLSKLIGLEILALKNEQKDLKKKIETYTKILSDKAEMLRVITTELEEIKTKFGTERKTILKEEKPAEIEKVEAPEIPLVLLIDRFGYAHSIDAASYEKNKEACENDYKTIIQTTSKGKVVLFTETKLHTIKMSDIPYGKLRDKGQPLDNLCSYDSKTENMLGIFSLNAGTSFLFVTSDGFAKVTPAEQFDLARKVTDASKLNDKEVLVAVIPYNEKGQLIVKTKQGYWARIDQSEVSVKLRNSIGSVLMQMDKDDRIDMAIGVSGASDTFCVGDKEYTADRIKLQKRRTKGVKARL